MSRIPIYLAGSSREQKRLVRWADELDLSGLFRITSRWFDDCDQWAGRDHELNRTLQLETAMMCCDAVRRASYFWMLWPEGVSDGSKVELGYAIGHRWHIRPTREFRIVISGANVATCIFTAAADIREANDHSAFQALVMAARGAR